MVPPHEPPRSGPVEQVNAAISFESEPPLLLKYVVNSAIVVGQAGTSSKQFTEIALGQFNVGGIVSAEPDTMAVSLAEHVDMIGLEQLNMYFPAVDTQIQLGSTDDTESINPKGAADESTVQKQFAPGVVEEPHNIAVVD